MIKTEELANPNSCINKAKDNEMVFVLLARDIAAPAAIQAWIDERVHLGKNKLSDPQIKEAYQCIEKMIEYQKNLVGDTKHEPNPKKLKNESEGIEYIEPGRTDRT